MLNFWNERYASVNFAYGEAPNEYFARELKKLKNGHLLFPAEGEGRNAVYAAELGFHVVAFDPSESGRNKALNLAVKKNTNIDYILASYESIQLEKDAFDGIVLIFAHMQPQLRQTYHRKLLEYLKPSGSLILQGFSKKQINRPSGGPKDIDILFSKEELAEDFISMTTFEIEETEVMLNEGEFHIGLASVIQFHGIK